MGGVRSSGWLRWWGFAPGQVVLVWAVLVWTAGEVCAQQRIYRSSVRGTRTDSGRFGRDRQNFIPRQVTALGTSQIIGQPTPQGQGARSGRLQSGSSGGGTGNYLSAYQTSRSDVGTRGTSVSRNSQQRGTILQRRRVPNFYSAPANPPPSLRNRISFPKIPRIAPRRGQRGEQLSQLSDLAFGMDGVETESGTGAASMIEMRRERLRARRTKYAQQGWAAFRNKDYARAMALFDSAGAISGADPQGQLGKFFSVFANRKWLMAGRMLERMLTSKEYDFSNVLSATATGRFDVRTYYADPSDLDSEARVLAGLALRESEDVGLNAMHAFVEWVRGERVAARTIAGRVARLRPDSSWARLYAAMERARRSSAAPASSATPDR